MDNEFEVFRDTFHYEGITLNTDAADEQVPQIERNFRWYRNGSTLHGTRYPTEKPQTK